MRVTVLRAGVVNEYGQPQAIGATITVGDDYGASLVHSLQASDTDGVLSVNAKRPFDTVPTVESDVARGVLNAAQVAALQSLVSGAGNQTLFVASDSILAQTLRAPSQSYGGTVAKGSYLAGTTRTVGVTDVYAEYPARFKFRAAHNLVTGDQVILDNMPSAHPLASRRLKVTVTAADQVTLDGIDATNMATLTSASAGSDAMAYVDMSYSDYGPLTWMLSDLGYPFSRIDGCMRPGATTTQLAAQIGIALTQQYTHGILWVGRNDAAWDQASTDALRAALLARCGYLLAVITYPDATANMTAGMLSKLKSIGDYWYAQQTADSRIRLYDAFGAISDPTATLEGAVSGLLASDGTHPQANGALRLGRGMAAAFPPIITPRRALSRVGSGSDNLLTGGRFTALTGGTLGGVMTGACVANWSLAAAADRSANVNGKYAQGAVTPAVQRRPSTVYAAGDILDVGDDYWYLVKTAGTTAASVPAGYATATLFDFSTGVTDGTAVVFRVPKWTDSMDRVAWQYMDLSVSADSGSEYVGLKQSIALPGSVAVGDYVRGQMECAILGGHSKGVTMRLTASDSTPTQICRAHSHSISTTLTAPPAGPIKARQLRTPALRVPASTATLDLRVVPYIPADGVQLAVALAVLEKVPEPGVIA